MNTQNRLKALDGLRGLAALSVSLSHIGFGITTILPFQMAEYAYRTLAVGPNSVQIFFVLSGFLMAYLYPSMGSVVGFIQKRYARIIPILSIVVFFLSAVHYFDYILTWYQEAGFLLGPALALFISWKILSRWRHASKIAQIIFFIFVLLQLAMLAFNLTIAPKLMLLDIYQTPLISSLHTGLSYLTLTMPFIRGTASFTSVLWSLPPEMYFYILYPILAIPVLVTVRKYPWYVGALIALAVVKVLFDMDEALRGVLNMRTMNVARTSGFIVGMVVGELSREMPRQIQQIFSHKWLNGALLIALILIQAGDWSVRDGESMWFMNQYYLMSSIVVGLVVIAAVIKDSLIERIFSHKILVFYGMISYSLYLTHSNVSKWIHQILVPYRETIPLIQLFSLVELGSVLALNIVISFLLYQLVEALYLNRKKTPKSATKNALKKSSDSTSRNRFHLGALLSLLVALSLSIFAYTGGYRFTQYASHHSYYAVWDVRSYLQNTISLLEKPTLRVPIKAQYDNLSVVTLNLWYYKNADVTRSQFKNPARLRFRLIDESTNKVHSETWWNAFDIESESNYPFGFSTIPDSKGKSYIAELYLENGAPLDHILFNAAPGKTQAIYTDTKSNILKKPYQLVFNRIGFVLTHPDSLFLIIMIGSIIYLGMQRTKNTNRVK